MNTKELEQKYELGVYPRRDVVLVGGKAARLFDDQGKEYIDCASNVGVSNIGHGHATVAKALYDQYLVLGNCYSMFYNPVRARLAEKLVNLAPANLTKVFFCNSGAEANEAALKFSRAATGKQEIIAAMRGFHGIPEAVCAHAAGLEARPLQ
jgi:acetylornithine/LysW-gamma-L-lysine aminotransferase